MQRIIKGLGKYGFCEHAISKSKQQKDYAAQLLTQNELERAKVLADAFLHLDAYEQQSLIKQYKEYLYRCSPLQIPKIPFKNIEQKEDVNEMVKELLDGKTIDDLKELFGAGNEQVVEEQVVQKEEEVKKEEVIEKSSFDIELKGFDSGSKIKIIKEIKQMYKLQLKEAKELVEKAPVTIQKSVSKEQAEDLKKTLEQLGCEINLL